MSAGRRERATAELDSTALQQIFSLLSPNERTLCVKPLSKVFRLWVTQQQGLKIDGTASVPQWALKQRLTESSYMVQKHLLILAAKLGYIEVLREASFGQQGLPWPADDVCEAAAREGTYRVRTRKSMSYLGYLRRIQRPREVCVQT